MLRKTAIITGAFGDIGKATAKKFAANGYNLALTYLSSFDNDFLNELKALGAEVLALRCDQTNESDIKNFINSVYTEFEYVDTAVLCAGKAEEQMLLIERATEDIDLILNTNLRGTILFSKEIGKRMLDKKHGTIEIISSVMGQTGGSLEAVYSATKAALINLTKSLAVELSPYVRINAVSPGFIKTKMTSEYNEETISIIRSETPLEKLGEPDDVANAVYFLASEESSFITGSEITVSGGIIKF